MNQSIDLRQTSIVDRVRLFDYLTTNGEKILNPQAVLLQQHYQYYPVFGCDPSDNTWKVAHHVATYPSLEAYYASREDVTPPVYHKVEARTVQELFKDNT